MDLNLFFALLGGLLVLAFVANRLVRYTRVPDVIILMVTGVLIGPVLHWVNPEHFHGVTQGFGALALLLILFEGGLDLKLSELLNHLAGGFYLSILCYVLSMLAVAIVSFRMQHLGWDHALLVGAVLGCVSSSIVLPVLQQVKLRREVRVTLLVEATLGDALAVLAVTTLLDIAAGGSASAKVIAWNLGSSLVLAVATGILAGMLWSYLLPALSEQRFWHVLTFGAVLLVYAGVHLLNGNSLVTVLVFGITLANFPAIRKRLDSEDALTRPDWFTETLSNVPDAQDGEKKPHLQMHTFHAELAFLIRTFFFVLLGVRLNFEGFHKGAPFAAVCFLVLFVARWLSIQSGRWLWPSFSRLEREIMVWFFPRGLITAVLGIQVLEARGNEFQFLPDLAFAVILLTNLILLAGTIRARSLPEISELPKMPVPV
ncbi:MAG TPA: cation:proton antiporter [Candidatus Acidoferrum sp.]|nr:cation:proton antiporter [Candidatus Acidoferrum sp.]